MNFPTNHTQKENSMKKFLLLIALVAITASGCATASTGADLKAVHYSGGMLSAKKYQNCLDPSNRSGYDPGDNYYAYPARQISYDATGGEGAESSRFTVVSKDNAELYVPVTVTFNLITDCTTLRKFHETLGSRYAAWFDSNGSSSDPNVGWDRMLNYVIGKPLDTTLDRVAQKYNYRDVWNNPEVKTEFEQAVNEDIDDLVARQAGGTFFENFTVLVLKPDPADPALKSAISEEQAAIAEANAEKAKAKADTATAAAQRKLAVAEAKSKRAEIQGFGGITSYLQYTCIITPECGNPFRDQFFPGVSTR